MSATLKNVLLLVITFFCFSFAHAQKIAHCNIDSLLNVMPERKIADSILQRYVAYVQERYKKMQNEYDTLSNKLTANAQVWSKEIITQKQKELQVKQNDMQAFQTDEQMNIASRREKLFMQLQKKILLAISMVAKENGYTLILNTAMDNKQVLYYDLSNNVTKKVKNKMDYMQPAWVHE